MNGDHDLLELAAKAAGISLYVNDYDQREGAYRRRIHWDPLTDDGDALRLAVNLGLDTTFGPNRVQNKYCAEYYTEEGNRDRYAATRRAIVRAAAEIGKAMP